MTNLEDRLRDHYSDRARREPLPGPSTDDALDALLRNDHRLVVVPDGGERRRPLAGWARRHQALLAAAAAVLTIVVVAGAIAAARDERAPVSTDPRPDTTTSPTPSTTSTTDTPSTSEATPTPGEATAPPPPAGLVVALEGVLGRWDGSQWVGWTLGAEPPGGDDYAIVRLDEPISTAPGRVRTRSCGSGGEPSIDLGLAFGEGPYEPAPIGVARVDTPRPRPVEVLDPASGPYQQAAADVAAELGITGPAPTATQAVRGDLDGDGTDEVLVTAERATEDTTSVVPNDVAIVFLRRADGSSNENVVLDKHYPGLEEAPGTVAFRIAALADLNGDGRMEVVVDVFQYESSGALVYELQPDGAIQQVLFAYCGG